ncbi:hypothetical protein JL857_20685 [Vibrio parahaemolyticus]|uniref:Uncharacterized protein n=1 Tax=Vibrio parahaemolyticus TaxID=670 RepID=A0A9Q3UIR5_VIBPH|nr:hypothetical protein [Vibrio parahaemolyticus]MCC3807511.1 hypothetical protein [Vibrio parahaemolyticus]MCI9696478.1 hypothetical protein [Vibrio parahaemolyticus]MCI9711058.1 hypothetical protein [Vibrio parahaemolyticus]MCI9715938.1 hypothetical protein [Vibrio parahaemolyticus]
MNTLWHRLERCLKIAFQFIVLPLIITITIQVLCFVGVVYCAFVYHPTPEWYSTLSPSDWQNNMKCLWQLSLEYTAFLSFLVVITLLVYNFVQNKAKSLSKKLDTPTFEAEQNSSLGKQSSTP